MLWGASPNGRRVKSGGVFRLEEGAQLGFEQFGIHTFGDADDAFEDEFHIFQSAFEPGFDFGVGGQKDKIRQGDTVNGGYKSDGDSVADALDILQMLHDLNEAKDSADDANGGSVAAGGFEHFRFSLAAAGGCFDFEFHDAAQILQVGAIDGQ